MAKPPILSIIIPTKNRYKYLKSILSGLLCLDSTKFEVIIQDNSDKNTEIIEFLSTIEDSRLRYFYTKTQISIIENFNNAVENSSGKYVCIIGDDDGVCSEIIELAEWAERKEIDSVVWPPTVFYKWPGYSQSGKLVILPFSGKSSTVNIDNELMAFVNNGGVFYSEHQLVKVYHGLVSRDLLNKVKSKTGNYFGGLSADIYSSIALSLEAKKTIYIDYPFSIGGSSAEARKTHNKEETTNLPIEKAPHLKGRGKYNWNKNVPYLYCGESIWAESACAAFVDLDKEEYLEKVSKYKLSAIILLNYPSYKDKIISDFLSTYDKGTPIHLIKLKLCLEKNLIWIKRSIDKHSRNLNYVLRRKTPQKTHGIIDINEAINILDSYNSKHKITLNLK